MLHNKLRFEEETHSYFLENQRIPSVTQVLGSVGISDFGNASPEVLERAAAFGTEAHLLTEKYDKDILIKGEEMSGGLFDYLVAWIDFRKDFGVEFIEGGIEKRFFCEGFRYAGTIDRIGKVNGKMTLIDIKTGAATRAHAIQIAAYKNALLEEYPKIDAMCVYLGPRAYKIQTYRGHDYDFNVFLSALNIHNWRSK